MDEFYLQQAMQHVLGIRDSNTIMYGGRLQFPRHVNQGPESYEVAKIPHEPDDPWHK